MNSRVLSGETQKQRESHSDGAGALTLRAVNTQRGWWCWIPDAQGASLATSLSFQVYK